jgi:hypothetical protein
MPVSVSIPIRIRINRTALERRPECTRCAAKAAVGRAMVSSAKTVIEPRGGFMGVTAHPPTFSWRGLPVNERERAAFERMLVDLIRSLEEEHGIRPPVLGPDVPEVIPDDPWEFYDDTRGSRFLERYTIDSYEGGQADVSVDGTKQPRLFEEVDVMKIITDIHDEALDKIFELAEHATEDKPLGIIFPFATGGNSGWQVIICDGSRLSDGTPKAVGLFQFPAFNALHFQGEKADPMFVNRPYMPSPGKGTAEIVELPSDANGRKAVYKDLFGDTLAQAFRRQSPKKVSMTTPKYNELIDESVARAVDQTVTRVGAGTRKAVKIKLAQAQMVLWMPPEQEEDLKWHNVARLTPITIREFRFKKDAKGGEPGGTGTETTARQSDGGGTGDCPRDEIEKDKWGELNGEPALDEIGDAGVAFQKRIAYIAEQLGIPEGKYAGQFCIDAGKKLIDLAIDTQSWDETSLGENKAAESTGNMGPIDFTPGGSPIIAAIRKYAGIVKSIAELMGMIEDTFMQKEYGCTVHGLYRGNGVGWTLHFLEEVVPVMKEAVYHLFVSGCRSSLLQLLLTSMNEIEKRQKAMDRYAPIFEKWIVPQITDIGELTLLHIALRNYQAAKYAAQAQAGVATGGVQITISGTAGDDWARSTAQLVSGLTGAAIEKSIGKAYDIVHVDGVDKVRDKKGNLWSSEEIDQAISLKSNVTMGIDPLFKQITDTPEAIKRFRTSESIRAELEKLLAEMLNDNLEMQYKAYSRPMFAFGATSRSEDIPHATVEGSKWALHGIHKVTHDQIGDAFRGTKLYAGGIDLLFDSEEGKASLKGFGLLVGMIALSVLVPGGGYIAFAVGVATAKSELDEAKEKKRLYRALIDPDKVISWAEVEVGLFVAWFGVVVSFIPEGASAVKGLVKGGKALVTGAEKAVVKAEGQTLAKRAASRVAKELAEYAAKDLLQAFLVEGAMNIVISQVIEQVLTPVIDGIQNESALGTTVESLGGDLQETVGRGHEKLEQTLEDEGDDDDEMNEFLATVLSAEGEE